MSPRKEAYHLHVELEAEGPLSVTSVRGAIAALTARHDVLRTCFPVRDGEPEALVLAPFEPEVAHRDPERLVGLLREQPITVFKAVPSLYRALVLAGGLETCRTLRLLWAGGEALPTELARDLRQLTGARLVNLYGPAEATVSAVFWEDDSQAGGPVVPIGRGIDKHR